jgi:hypothetical protein
VVEIAALPEALAAELGAAASLAAAGRLEQAVAAYQSLLARQPDLPDCWYELGLLQRRLRRFEAALESYAEALARGAARPEEVHLNRGVIFADCLRQDAAAERELRAALALNPAYLPALQNLANLHEDLGRREEALVTYERILALEPRAFEALARYAQLAGASTPRDPLIGRLRGALADPSATAADRASLGFALAMLLDGLEAYPEALAVAAAANRASRASAPAVARYDRAAHERFVDALIAAFPRPRTVGTPPAGAVGAAVTAGEAEPQLIFICGMYRSGSTLTERLLAGHPQIVAGGELDLLPYLVQSTLAPFPQCMAAIPDAALARLAASYLQGVRRLFPDARNLTDKRPDNFLLIGLIKTLFPWAKIVHTTRDPLDTCLSIFLLHLDPRMPWALDLLDTGHYFRQYQRLMRHWRSLYGDDILDFSYDHLVSEPRPAVQRLLAFCGLEWSESCLDLARSGGAVKTASVWQVREALYRRASGRARHYAGELAALAAYLAAS